MRRGLERFEREAKAIGSLNHPHICVLYDVGRQDDMPYIVMEHIEGETLEKRLQTRTAAARLCFRIRAPDCGRTE